MRTANIAHAAMRACLAVSLCFAVVLSHAADVPTLNGIRDTQTIRIAYREASVPFSYLDADKKPVGYAIDLCLKIAEAVRRELKLQHLNIRYLPVTPSTRIAAMVEGQADLECGSTTNNVERRKEVVFTIPHFVATSRMIVRADSGIRNWFDLRNKRVVTSPSAQRREYEYATGAFAARYPALPDRQSCGLIRINTSSFLRLLK